MPLGICDTQRIYNSEFEFPMPQNIVKQYLAGNGFDNKEEYSEEESQRLYEDINENYDNILSAHPKKEKIAVITAGAPGAGKTFKIHEELKFFSTQGQHYAYVCPDDVCLKNLKRTYIKDLESSSDAVSAYNKWRPGSNAAAQLILANLIRENYAFYFGSTSSHPATGLLFDFLKKRGYQIRLIHVTASDETRWKSIQERNNTFFKTTEEDIKAKGLAVSERINDTYLKYADQIDFYYRGGPRENTVLAAKWLRVENEEAQLGKLQVVDSKAYEEIKKIHNKSTQILNKPQLSWQETVEKSSIIL
ncbi:MAG: hypothetical protein BGO14_01235 [Chlamydiales bacterium 38-26]|nr:zeta toxin family protein [Chlamydiales bacterium]OJV10071.1 MAG: hypothetical protein BGO14_01235 [Chlamydiales bacterium 38-26]